LLAGECIEKCRKNETTGTAGPVENRDAGQTVWVQREIATLIEIDDVK
jgi:hypothetical protein